METDVMEMEAVLAARGVRIGAFCEQAGIARTTWDRWKQGKTLPNMRTWGKVRRVYRAILSAAPTENPSASKGAAA